MFSVEYSKSAARALRKMPGNVRSLIFKKVSELAKAPKAMRNVKKLTDHPGYRLRVGDWRIVYLVNQGRLVIVVVKIEPRGGVYK
ncbi:MAG: type II toxin-antitoxin system RelE/ParE family toxin [Mariprofundaceae bacterium]|nr:type II toxin-antitoxin system RelE/ParE family toxin [Mariprofundaceae bacterium]